ncbi:MAG: SdpI family protein [Oscillibacter sp.]|nr:SdpI family protein [Oscillibacter sp.]
MKNEKKGLVLTTLICLLPVVVGALLYKKLPEELVTHWNFAGTPDGWSSRAFTVFAIPLLLTALHVVMFAALRADPRRANISPALRAIVKWTVPAVSVLVYAITYGNALGWPVDVATIAPLFMGAVFLAVGNYLPKTKQSRTVGIRLPWTLASEENWTRTHRLAGFLWVLGGVVSIVVTLFRAWSAAAFFAILLVMVAVPCLYSYLLHRKGI